MATVVRQSLASNGAVSLVILLIMDHNCHNCKYVICYMWQRWFATLYNELWLCKLSYRSTLLVDGTFVQCYVWLNKHGISTLSFLPPYTYKGISQTCIMITYVNYLRNPLKTFLYILWKFTILVNDMCKFEAKTQTQTIFRQNYLAIIILH